MTIWFIRCNGETAHKQPGTSRYVPGEPPRWPAREFTYHDKCLEDDFARYGLPAAEGLRHPGDRRDVAPRIREGVRSAHAKVLRLARSADLVR